MWNIKKITILLCFLSLVAFISCSAEDKTGSPKPEGEIEITGETGGSGSGSGESGSGSGGETGETETTEIGNFPPPEGTYKDTAVTSGYTVVSKVDENTTKIKGKANGTLIKTGYSSGQPGFDFNISKWKKTKTTLEAVSDSIEDIYNTTTPKHTDISIIYDNDTQTLKITFKDAGAECLFNGTKQP